MEAVLKSCIDNTSINQAFNNLYNNIDLTKLDNPTLTLICDLSKLGNELLKQSCDPSKLTVQDLFKTIDFEYNILKYLANLNLNDFKLIEFEKMTEAVLQKILGYLLVNKSSIDYIKTILNNMTTVNYGNHYLAPPYDKINPLIYCCFTNKELALVQLLVEKFGADIEHLSCCGTTAIMFAAQSGNEIVTKYLYDKGAKLLQSDQCIYSYASKSMTLLLRKWETEKFSHNNDNSNKQVNNDTKQSEKQDTNYELKENYEALKLEIVEMKRSFEKVSKMLEALSTHKTC